jgi:hypothetical protein
MLATAQPASNAAPQIIIARSPKRATNCPENSEGRNIASTWLCITQAVASTLW